MLTIDLSVALGYQHSIANFFLVPIGMFYGTNFSVGKFIYQSVIPVTIGNIIGGSGLTGAMLWFLYGRNDTLATKTGQPLSGEKKSRGGISMHGVSGRGGENGETVTAGNDRGGPRGVDMV
jgi:hypothetical protein